MNQLPRYDTEKGENTGALMAYAWPGGYPIYYIVADCGVLCPKCANMAEAEGLANNPDDKQWHIVQADVNYEDNSLYCDHCSERIERAYAEGEAQREANEND